MTLNSENQDMVVDRSILIAEDNPEDISILTEMLKKTGFRIRIANNGEQAVNSAKADPPDLVLMDIQMPVMDGYEACRQIKSIPGQEDTPIIFVSAMSETYNTVKAFEAGGADFLMKPIYEKELLARIDTQLDLIHSRKILESRVAARTADLQRSRDQLRMLSQRLEGIREDERARLSRNIHDDLGQALTAIGMDLARLKRHSAAEDQDVNREIEALEDLVQTTGKTVQQLSAHLRPGILDDLGLIPAIEWYLNGIAKRENLDISMDLGADPELFNPEITTVLYRILQEMMTNIFRHAQATKADVILKEEGKSITLAVCDNGVGIKEEQVKDSMSIGLLGIRERLIPWDGHLEITGEAEKGTCAIVRIPIDRLESGSV